MNLLELVPVRIAEWEEVGERVVVIRPAPESKGLRSLLDRLLYELAAKRLRLDEVGSFAWRQLDGTRTVGEVAVQLRERFGDAVEPAEQRLGKLVSVFRREGLVAYPGFDDTEGR
ncbi:MAG: PqqD family peptide modification chaperone [Gemmatimonadales bacterium]|nr:PqqD family peptide modification chaperone [Gemmatimonadales bacterium]NIR01526.1 PqqD family peptide modification chaperone [Gemmatimonadales bacterium]